MRHSRKGSRRVVFPLIPLALLFVLAAMNPGATESPTALAAKTGPGSPANSQATTLHRPSALLEGVVIASFSALLGGGLWLTFLFVRLIGRRPKKHKAQYRRETPRARGADLLMLAMVVALGVMAVVGLRIAFASRHETFRLPTMAVRHLGFPSRRPQATASAPSIRRSARRGVPFERAIILAGLVGLAFLALYGVRRGWEPMKAQKGPGSAAPVARKERSAGKDTASGVRRSYATMCRLLAPIVPFRPTATPREYAEEIRRAGVECPAVLSLTLLFELDRYGGCTTLPAKVEVPRPRGERIVIDPGSADALLASVAASIPTGRVGSEMRGGE